MSIFARAKKVITERILGLSDTPRRIAWGVFIGTVVAWTPTIGLQIVIYVTLATMLRANKVSGIPILFISNPVTAVPLYWFCWRVGTVALGSDADASSFNVLQERLAGAEANAAETSLLAEMWSADFWRDVGQVLMDLGLEIWAGSLLVGFAMAIPCYFLTFWAVNAYRRNGGAPTVP